MRELKVLGPMQAFRDGEEVDLGGPTQRRLLASLVARSGEVVSVTSLLDDLWGEDPPPSGPQSIQSYVSRLRRQLGGDIIETQAPGYRLGTNGVVIDSVEFLELARALPSSPVDRLEQVDLALEMWSGPPFEDFDHVDFAARHLVDMRHDIEEERARLLARSGQGAAAVALLERITNTAPLRESAWITLSQVLSQAGRQAEAVRTLDRYRDNLADIGLEPGPAFTAAQNEVFEAATTGVGVERLPRVETSFLGREAELAELVRLVSERRLVTVVGPGGMGKTRLALETARAWTSTPAVFASLSSLSDEREVGPAILSAIGGETRGNPIDSILARLSRNPSLLVIDNAEHVIEAAASIAFEIVTGTDTVVLVTSREPLNVPGEAILALESLDPERAIELYRDRAKDANPDFEASSATLDMLCEELDYMPLAIEMAAGRAAALSPDEILARLSPRYGLLDKPRRGGEDRHRSLDAMVDWSYSLLSEDGQRVFERLSVVAGSFDLDTAAALAGFGNVGPSAVLGILADLVDRSLIRRTSKSRFRMLRVLKSYAEQQLALSGDETETRTNHARWFANLATEIGTGLSTPDESSWIETANAAVDDLTDALSWSVQTGDLTNAQMILEGLFDWFYHRQPPAITEWGDLVQSLAGDHDVRSVASAWASLAALKQGQAQKARDLASAGTAVDGPSGRFAWFMTGEVACYEDRLDEALSAYRKQLVRATNLDDRIGVVDAMAGETLALAYQGVFERAVDSAIALEKVATDIGAPTYRAYAVYALGEAVAETEPERSAELLQQATDLANSVNNYFIQALSRTALGSVLSRLGRYDEAAIALHDAMDLWESMGMPGYRWAVIQYLGALLAQTGDLESAARLLSSAESAGRSPLGAGQRHWQEVAAQVQTDDSYANWSGRPMRLEEASEFALTATRLRPDAN